MLPSLANQLHVAITHAQVALVQRSGIRRHVIAQHRMGLDAQNPDWQEVIQALDAVLAKVSAKGAHLGITFGSEYLRYLVLPAQATALNNTERLGYAQAAMREVYGNVVSDWQIQCDDVPPNTPAIAVALDTAVMSSIEALAEKHQLRLQSIQPFMASAINRLRKQIGNKDGMLVIVEETCVLIAQLTQGICQQIRSYQRTDDWRQALPAWLNREQLLAEQETPDVNQVLLYTPADKSQAVQLPEPWRLTRIGLSNPLNAHYAMLEVVL